jgi:hypothetical protein
MGANGTEQKHKNQEHVQKSKNSHNFLSGFFVELKKEDIFAIAITENTNIATKFLKNSVR